MKIFKFLVFCFFILSFSNNIVAKDNDRVFNNDSIILAQAYINLSLTEKYFDTLSPKRISKIIPFVESELSSIKDQRFINQNAKLYNFTYSLLYFNKVKFMFRNDTVVDRNILKVWKKTLDKSITHFNLSDTKGDYSNDVFYDLINFNTDSRDTLHQSIFKLKRKMGIYFNTDIYPEFKRMFKVSKTDGPQNMDSLSYYAKIYDLEFNTSILNHDYNAYNYDFGPKTLSIGYQYLHIQRNYDYWKNYSLDDPYLLDPKLDLISRYLQLQHMASASYNKSLNPFKTYKLYNAYHIYLEEYSYYATSEDFKLKDDVFFKNELYFEVSELLFQHLRNKFPYDSFILAQSYINLSIITSNISELSSENISKILSAEKNALLDIKDTKFMYENSTLYNFTYSLFHFNEAKLLYKDKSEINRYELVQWKNSLERAMRSYNFSINRNIPSENLEQDGFYELIKFTGDSRVQLSRRIYNLKREFTPFFNADTYPEFKRIFNVAKSTGRYEFESLFRYASIYNLSLKMTILNSRSNTAEEFSTPSIELNYSIDPKLDLISRYLQLKYLASVKVTKLPEGLSVDKLYDDYVSLERDAYGYNDAFFEKELNSKALGILFEELQDKYPYQIKDYDGDGVSDVNESELNLPILVIDDQILYTGDYFYFPNPAPKASADLKVSNYKPKLPILGDVDRHMSGILKTAGYEKHINYYYHELDGFAMTTSLEKFNMDGSKVQEDERWVTNLGSDGKFSYYETFKSLFFELESEFRMFAFIVGSENITISNTSLSAGFAEQLIKNSYSSLPEDLKYKTLPNKTLSVLVYHFHQNDIGKVPMLDISGKISALDHLNIAGLSKLIDHE